MKNRSSAVLLAVSLSATPLLAAQASEPKSGRVVIVQEQKASATVRPSIMRMPVTALAGATNVAHVDESYDHLFMAQTDENGNIVIVCTDSHEAAQVTSSSTETVLRLKPRATVKRMGAERE